MKTTIMLGAAFITIAVIIYTITIIFEIKQSKISKKMFRLFMLAVAFDFLATTCMFIAAGRLVLNTHGTLGFTALLLMLTKLIYVSRFNTKHELGTKLPKNIQIISLFIYIYWIIAYINGLLTAMH